MKIQNKIKCSKCNDEPTEGMPFYCGACVFIKEMRASEACGDKDVSRVSLNNAKAHFMAVAEWHDKDTLSFGYLVEHMRELCKIINGRRDGTIKKKERPKELSIG